MAIKTNGFTTFGLVVALNAKGQEEVPEAEWNGRKESEWGDIKWEEIDHNPMNGVDLAQCR